MEFLRDNQLNIMLVLSGICVVLAILSVITRSLSGKRRGAMLIMTLGAFFLLLFERYSYIFRGDVSDLGWWMVRISNFMVFLMTLMIIFGFNMYLADLFANDIVLAKFPRSLRLSQIITFAGIITLIISEFTGFYYTFDATNHYQRGQGYIVSVLFPLFILLIDLSIILRHRKKFRSRILTSLLIFTLAPLAASLLQLFAYGISITSIVTGLLVIILHITTMMDLNDTLEWANKLEIEMLKNEQNLLRNQFRQTAESLATAVDAKDTYTHGHSTRVAEYSVKIAKLSGKNKKECENIYFTALLHDVGKIGMPDAIINKPGKLTPEEYNIIKQHPVISGQILTNIKDSPYLSIGARYHHERYDGKGYPEGLKGEEIPEIARIIAVADAYDAMTSQRSYRDVLPQEYVRNEFEEGLGTQFDPEFGSIMLEMIDEDTEYRLREVVNISETSC